MEKHARNLEHFGILFPFMPGGNWLIAWLISKRYQCIQSADLWCQDVPWWFTSPAINILGEAHLQVLWKREIHEDRSFLLHFLAILGSFDGISWDCPIRAVCSSTKPPVSQEIQGDDSTQSVAGKKQPRRDFLIDPQVPSKWIFKPSSYWDTPDTLGYTIT